MIQSTSAKIKSHEVFITKKWFMWILSKQNQVKQGMGERNIPRSVHVLVDVKY